MEADILKQELGTQGNTLSFWKCEKLDDSMNTKKAILLSTTGIKTTMFYILTDELVEKYGLEMDDKEEGKTAYKGFEKLHINMKNLTYSKIGLVLQMLHEAFQIPELTCKMDKETVKACIEETIKANLMNVDALNDGLRRDIERSICMLED